MSIKKNSTNYIKLEKDNYFPKTIMIKIGDVVPKIIDLSRDYDLSLTKSDFIIEPIYFEFDSHEITPHSKEQLDKLASGYEFIKLEHVMFMDTQIAEELKIII